MFPQIIGITGRKFNGKDTLGNYLVENYEYKKLSYADPIKDISRILFGFNDEQLYGNSKEIIDPNWDVTPRTVMQFLGTEIFRKQMHQIIPNIEENFWIKCLEVKMINELKENPNKRFVICDVRFPNELEAIKKLGGIVIRVKRNLSTNGDTHESEKFIDELDVDFEIENSGNKAELYEKFETKLNFNQLSSAKLS